MGNYIRFLMEVQELVSKCKYTHFSNTVFECLHFSVFFHDYRTEKCLITIVVDLLNFLVLVSRSHIPAIVMDCL